MKNLFKKYLILIGLFLVVYSVFVFVIPFAKQNIATFVITYITSVIAISAQAYFAKVSFSNESLKSKFYGFPIAKVGFVYLLAQLIVSIIVYVVGAFVNIAPWIIIIIEVVIIALAAFGLITTTSYKDVIEELEEKVVVDKSFISKLKLDASSYVYRITSKETKELFDKFVDIVKYSDPISNDSLKSIENEIDTKFNEIKDLINQENYLLANREINTIINLMNSRNELCKRTK